MYLLIESFGAPTTTTASTSTLCSFRLHVLLFYLKLSNRIYRWEAEVAVNSQVANYKLKKKNSPNFLSKLVSVLSTTLVVHSVSHYSEF